MSSVETISSTHRAVRLHGAKDLRVEDLPAPAPPAPGEARLRITAVGICGSDLHTYLDGRIGDTTVESPFVLGHEFAGVVEQAGPDTFDAHGKPLSPDTRVAVEPARPCKRCELCEMGHPNLCPHHTFAGVFPTEGAFQQWLTVPGDTCFPVPDALTDTQAAMLEPLGVGIHAVDLAHIKPGYSVAIVGAGTIGLCCLQMARLAGAAPLFVTDRHDWRLDTAKQLGATPIHIDDTNPVDAIMQHTNGRGVDVALECAWSSEDAVAQAVNVLRPGGRLVVVGIAGDDRLVFNHSAVRRRGLTIAMCRRMKHTYPRAIELTRTGHVDLDAIVTDHLGLDGVAAAFDDACAYRPGLIKAVVHPDRP